MEAIRTEIRSVGLPKSRTDAHTFLRTHRRTGDQAARSRLIEAHLPLVRALARRYTRQGESLEDLVQVGAVGLIEAVDRFDPERGGDLVGFAVPTITGELKHHLRDRTGTIRVPRRLQELTRRLEPQRQELAARLSRPPTVSELAREAGVCEQDVMDAIHTQRARALSPLPATDGSSNVDRGVVVDGGFDSCEDRLLLAAGFRTLAERERRILHLRFYGGLSQAEIAREVGLSQIQVSRLIRSSLERMRGALGDARGARADGGSGL